MFITVIRILKKRQETYKPGTMGKLSEVHKNLCDWTAWLKPNGRISHAGSLKTSWPTSGFAEWCRICKFRPFSWSRIDRFLLFGWLGLPKEFSSKGPVHQNDLTDTMSSMFLYFRCSWTARTWLLSKVYFCCPKALRLILIHSFIHFHLLLELNLATSPSQHDTYILHVCVCVYTTLGLVLLHVLAALCLPGHFTWETEPRRCSGVRLIPLTPPGVYKCACVFVQESV